MATYTAGAGGGNWSANATWGGAGHPIAGDTAIIASGSGTVNVDVNSACAILTIQASKIITFGNVGLTVSGDINISGTFTINGSSGKLYIGGNVVNVSKGSIGGQANIIMNGTGAIGQITFGCSLEINTAGTITFTNGSTTGFSNTSGKILLYTAGTVITTGHTLALYTGNYLNCSGIIWNTVTWITGGALASILQSDFNCTNFYTASFSNGFDLNFTGAFHLNFTNLYIIRSAISGGSITIQAGERITISGVLNCIGNILGTSAGIFSGTPSSKIYVDYTGTMNNIAIYNTIFTDVTYSGIPCYAWYSPTPVRCIGIKNITGANIGGAGVSVCVI